MPGVIIPFLLHVHICSMMFTHTAQRHLYVQIRHYRTETLKHRGRLSSSTCQWSQRGLGCRASAATVSEQAKEEIQQVCRDDSVCDE